MRQCGSCTLCCKLLPVSEGNTKSSRHLPVFEKPANTRCQHQRHGVGCKIYDRRPMSCRVWTCQWLAGGEATRDLPRPDRCGYVIDIAPDLITFNMPNGPKKVPVIQIWTSWPDAHRDPALRAFLEVRAANLGMAALVRLPDQKTAIAMIPPTLPWGDGEWHEIVTTESEPQNSYTQIAQVLDDYGLEYDPVRGMDQKPGDLSS